MVAGIIALKATILYAVVWLMTFPHRTAMAVGLGLAQVGEFSFLLATVGRANGLLDEALYQLLIASAVITMLATPALSAAAPRLALRLPARMRRRADASPPEPAGTLAPLEGHVVVVGFGVSGRNVARVLRQAGIPYLVIDLDGETVRAARRDDEPIVYGDAARHEILERARMAEAEVVVFNISDPVALRTAVAVARSLNPRVYIVVRVRRLAEMEGLYRRGADEVVAEEFETSIEIFTRVLARFAVPPNIIDIETRLLRGDKYRMLRSPAGERELSDKLVNALGAGTTAVFLLEPESPAVRADDPPGRSQAPHRRHHPRRDPRWRAADQSNGRPRAQRRGLAGPGRQPRRGAGSVRSVGRSGGHRQLRARAPTDCPALSPPDARSAAKPGSRSGRNRTCRSPW